MIRATAETAFNTGNHNKLWTDSELLEGRESEIASHLCMQTPGLSSVCPQGQSACGEEHFITEMHQNGDIKELYNCLKFSIDNAPLMSVGCTFLGAQLPHPDSVYLLRSLET